MTDPLNSRNRLWAALERRAERADELGVLPNFVEATDPGPIFDTSSMVFFGRRGAGKTHTLLHLARSVRSHGDVAVYVDMRRISSNAGIYNDRDVAYGTRATNMLVDVMSDVHDEIYRLAIIERTGPLSDNLHAVGPALDEVARQLTDVRVTGEYSTTKELQSTRTRRNEKNLSFHVSGVPNATYSRTSGQSSVDATTASITESGSREVYIHLGKLDRALRALSESLGGARLWLLIDEWSEGIPYELQPVLADMLRRTFMRIGMFTVKIAAIEHRSNFTVEKTENDQIGLELGSDTAETMRLDSALAIGVDPSSQLRFLRRMLNEHYAALARLDGLPISTQLVDVVGESFADRAFGLLGLASEGNPRDAINLVSKAARRAGAAVISAEDVLVASSDYFWDTKYKNIEGNRDLERLFGQFMEISLSRGRRTMLVERNHPKRRLIDKLYDKRLVHLLRSGLRPTPGGGILDAYAIDFGSYADKWIQGSMRWSNDGWISGHNLVLGDQESWRDAVLRRKFSESGS